MLHIFMCSYMTSIVAYLVTVHWCRYMRWRYHLALVFKHDDFLQSQKKLKQTAPTWYMCNCTARQPVRLLLAARLQTGPTPFQKPSKPRHAHHGH